MSEPEWNFRQYQQAITRRLPSSGLLRTAIDELVRRAEEAAVGFDAIPESWSAYRDILVDRLLDHAGALPPR